MTRIVGSIPQFVAGIVVVCWSGAGAAAERDPVSFNRDIRPILSDRCFTCHGPDANTRQADLRLDVRDAAIAAGALAPGDPDASLLIERIRSDDPRQVMPPPKLQKPLSATQKDLLERWIRDGAAYEPHWSLIPVPRVVPVPGPPPGSGPVANPIDAFVQSGLRSAGREPAPPAPRATWLRRASFDLTGLPPTVAELDDFLADDSPEAFERAADRLLASAAYGERMASEWLDAARYADTFGYQTDRDLHGWPWRDWVIRAFNENLPFDQFILWQTAGDLLPQPTRDQRLATAFNRLHRQTAEGGSIEEEFRVVYVADRVTTNATAFLGLTFECARCHDHKFDPISQADFYRFSAFFAGIDEHGLYSHFTETAPTPALLLYEGDQEARHRDVLARIRDAEGQLAVLREAGRLKWIAAPASDEGIPLETIEPTARFTFDDLQPSGDFRPIPGRTGQAIEFGGDDAYTCNGAGQFGRVTPFSYSLWVRPTEHRPRTVLLHQSVAAEDAGYRGHALLLDSGRPVFSLVHFWPGNALRVEARETIPLGEWTHLTVTYDGGSRAAGLRLYVNGKRVECDVVRDRLTRDTRYRSDWGDGVSQPVELALGARFRDIGFRGGALDDLLVFDRELTAVEVSRLAGATVALSEADRLAHYLARQDEGYQTCRARLEELRREENELIAQVRQIMVMSELPDGRPTHVLRRGAYDDPQEQVRADTPASILPFAPELPRNRLGLARWLTDDRNPLVARVTVNRLWQQFFGRGLVATAEDFGSQGQPPTHPELLDWLARDLMGFGGWDLKALCRRIVLSETYRQSSTPRDPRTLAEDPDNRLLARGPRHRLSAEQIRDNALSAAGLLAVRLGGPSVMPYQPAGLWEEAGTGKTYSQSQGEGLYRRSLYTFWRRTSPPPSMLSFDATTREVCIARRERTATPLQALVLLNDPQFVEAARVLAASLIRQCGPDPDAPLSIAFRLLTSRPPTSRELDLLRTLREEQRAHFATETDAALALLSVGDSPRDASLDPADHAALTAVVSALLNYDECVMKR